MDYKRHVRGVSVAAIALGLTLTVGPVTSYATDTANESVSTPETAQTASTQDELDETKGVADGKEAAVADKVVQEVASKSKSTEQASKKETVAEKAAAAEKKAAPKKEVKAKEQTTTPKDVLKEEKAAQAVDKIEKAEPAKFAEGAKEQPLTKKAATQNAPVNNQMKPLGNPAPKNDGEEEEIPAGKHEPLITYDPTDVGNKLNLNGSVGYLDKTINKEFTQSFSIDDSHPGSGLAVIGLFYIDSSMEQSITVDDWYYCPEYGNTLLAPYSAKFTIKGKITKLGPNDKFAIYLEDRAGNKDTVWFAFRGAPDFPEKPQYTGNSFTVDIPEDYEGTLVVTQPDGTSTEISKNDDGTWSSEDGKTIATRTDKGIEITNPDISYEVGDKVTVADKEDFFKAKTFAQFKAIFSKIDITSGGLLGDTTTLSSADSDKFDAVLASGESQELVDPTADGGEAFFTDTFVSGINTYTKMQSTNDFKAIEVTKDENGVIHYNVYYQADGDNYTLIEGAETDPLPDMDLKEFLDSLKENGDELPTDDQVKDWLETYPEDEPYWDFNHGDDTPDTPDNPDKPDTPDQPVNPDKPDHHDGHDMYSGDTYDDPYWYEESGKNLDNKAEHKSVTLRALPKTNDKNMLLTVGSVLSAGALLVFAGLASLRKKNNRA